MSKESSLCELLRDEFLQGREVCITTFANRHGVTRQGVYLALRHFGELVGKGSRRGTVKCSDLRALREFVPPATRPRGEVAAPFQRTARAWDALLSAWGLPLDPPNIVLPARTHVLALSEPNN